MNICQTDSDPRDILRGMYIADLHFYRGCSFLHSGNIQLSEIMMTTPKLYTQMRGWGVNFKKIIVSIPIFNTHQTFQDVSAFKIISENVSIIFLIIFSENQAQRTQQSFFCLIHLTHVVFM